MPTINAYLNFKGNTEEAFDFYKSVFGGEYSHIARYKDMPAQEGCASAPPELGEKILHVSLPISSETVLMASDVIDGFGPPVTFGNNISLSINVSSREEADRLFNGLSVGGNVFMPMGQAFWGAYFGSFADKFGIINWLINFDEQPQG